MWVLVRLVSSSIVDSPTIGGWRVVFGQAEMCFFFVLKVGTLPCVNIAVGLGLWSCRCVLRSSWHWGLHLFRRSEVAKRSL